jgi:hypothetical protein
MVKILLLLRVAEDKKLGQTTIANRNIFGVSFSI